MAARKDINKAITEGLSVDNFFSKYYFPGLPARHQKVMPGDREQRKACLWFSGFSFQVLMGSKCGD